jgi:hypothetical protein
MDFYIPWQPRRLSRFETNARNSGKLFRLCRPSETARPAWNVRARGQSEYMSDEKHAEADRANLGGLAMKVARVGGRPPPGALDRVALREDRNHAHRRLADTEQRMIGVLNELASPDWSPRSQACPRLAPPRSWPRQVTRAGSRPPARWSSMPGWHRKRNCPARSPYGPDSPARARPGLRPAAWRAVWGAQRANLVVVTTATAPPWTVDRLPRSLSFFAGDESQGPTEGSRSELHGQRMAIQ